MGLTTLLFLMATLQVGEYPVYSWLLDLASLTEDQKVAIDQLRTLVEYNLTSEYMEEDAYLVKWLSAKDYRVEEAAQFLLENLAWRKEQKVDTIFDENWTAMEYEFPYEFGESFDMEGRPILYFYFGQWNIHKLMTEEDSLVLLGRYLVKMMEESERRVRELRRQKGETSLTPLQFQLIINFDGYDIWNQGCFQCLHFYRGFCQTVEAHFPRAIHRAILVNVPTAFEVIFWYLEAPLAEKTRSSVKLYGMNRKIWTPAILSFVEKNQMPMDLVEPPVTPEGDEYITTYVMRAQNNTL